MSIFRLPLVLVCLLQLGGCQVYEFAAIQLNNQMAEALWDKPNHESTVPLSLLQNLPMVSVQVNGKPLRFVVDTGAAVSVLLETPTTASLRLNKVGEVSISGAGEGVDSVAHVVDDVTLKVGTVKLEDLRFIYIPFNQIAFFDHPDEVFFDGIIGIDVLKKFAVKFDYDEMSFHLAAPDHRFVKDGLEAENWQLSALDFNGMTPYIQLEMQYADNTPPVQVELLVDTGSSGFLGLEVNEEKHITLPKTYVSVTGLGVTGEITSRITTMEYLKMGNEQMNSLPVSLTVSGGPSDSRDGVLGNKVLSRFNQVYDFQNDQVWLQANRKMNQPTFLPRTGLGLLSLTKGANVKRITAGSAAEIQGIVAGDLITSINGVKVSRTNYDQLRHEMSHPDQDVANICWQRAGEHQCGSLSLFVPFATESL
jgi:predicted aspartyl protease